MSGVKSVRSKKRRIGGETSTAAEPLDIVQNNATGQNTSTSGVVICMKYTAPHPRVFTGAYTATTAIRGSKPLHL